MAVKLHIAAGKCYPVKCLTILWILESLSILLRTSESPIWWYFYVYLNIFFCSTTTDNSDLSIYLSYLSRITQRNSDELGICHKVEKLCFKNLLGLQGDNFIVTYYIIFYKILKKPQKIKPNDIVNLRRFIVRQDDIHSSQENILVWDKELNPTSWSCL